MTEFEVRKIVREELAPGCLGVAFALLIMSAVLSWAAIWILFGRIG